MQVPKVKDVVPCKANMKAVSDIFTLLAGCFPTACLSITVGDKLWYG